MKALNKKGFTLAELLIVMAIVVVLASIAIPTFGKQLEVARETADVEAIRAEFEDIYTQAYIDFTTNEQFTNHTVSTAANGLKDAENVYLTSEITLSQRSPGFEYVSPQFAMGDGDVITLKETGNPSGALKTSTGAGATYLDTAVSDIAVSTDKVLATVAKKKVVIGFVFQANGTPGNNEAIKLMDVYVSKVS